jgi:hypothetical protein
VLFGNVIDFSGGEKPFVRGVQQSGSIAAGYSALEIATADGNDVCFVSYLPSGVMKAAGLETDAVQAYARNEGGIVTALYLAGGKSLKCGGALIDRSEPGLAYVEKLPDGQFVVGNPSPTDATVTVMLPAMAGLSAYEMNGDGSRGAATGAVSSGNNVELKLKAGAKVLFGKS